MTLKEKIDCLFLVTKSSGKTYQKLSVTYSAIEPPTWALLLAQSTRDVGFKVNILDANAEDMSEEKILKRVKNLKPKLICLVVYGQNVNSGTTNMSGAISLLNYLKQSTGTGIDISKKAILIARENASKSKLYNRVKFSSKKIENIFKAVYFI